MAAFYKGFNSSCNGYQCLGVREWPPSTRGSTPAVMDIMFRSEGVAAFYKGFNPSCNGYQCLGVREWPPFTRGSTRAVCGWFPGTLCSGSATNKSRFKSRSTINYFTIYQSSNDYLNHSMYGIVPTEKSAFANSLDCCI